MPSKTNKPLRYRQIHLDFQRQFAGGSLTTSGSKE